MVDFKKGIDTSKLSGDWEKWAKEADKKGNKDDKYLNSAFEFNYVKDKAYQEVKNGNMSQRDMASVFGGMNTTNAISDSEMADILSGNDIQDSADPATKTGKKAKQETVKANIQSKGASYFQGQAGGRNLDDPIDWKNVANDLKELYKGESVSNPEYYAKLCDEVDKIAQEMDKLKFNDDPNAKSVKNYNSRNDINILYKSVKKQIDLDSNDEFKGFKLDVLKEFVKIAENHQKAKERAKIEARYNELASKGLTYTDQKGDEKTKSLTRTQIAEQLEKEFKAFGSYYDSYYSIDQSEKFDKKVDVPYNHKGLISEVINSKIQAGADNLVARTILSLRKPTNDEVKANPKLLEEYNTMIKQYGLEKYDLSDGKDIEKAAKQVLEKQGLNDKYTDKAFSGRGTKLGERSTVKGERYWIAAINRVEAKKAQLYTAEDFYDVIKDKTVFEQLANNGTLIQKKDGKYDISALSDLIRDVISKTDYRLSKGNESEYAEINNLRTEIGTRTGVTISDKDLKRLVDFCGFDRDKKDLATILSKLAKGAIGGIIPGLVNFGTSQILASFIDEVDTSEATQRLLDSVVNVTTNIGAAHFKSTLDFTFNTTVNGTPVDDADVEITQKSINAQNRKWRTQFKDIVDENGEYIGPKMKLVDVDGHKYIQIEGDVTKAQSFTNPVKLADILGEDFDIKQLGIEDQESKPWRDFKWMMGMNMALGALQEAFTEIPGENPVLTWEVAADSFEEYVKKLQYNTELTPKMKEAVALMADSFRDAEGNWMPQEFEAYLKQFAGGGQSADGSKLRTGKINIHELYNGTIDRLNNIKVVPKKPEPAPKSEPETKTEPKPVEQQTITQQTTEPVKAVEKFAAIKEEDNVNVQHSSWPNVIKIYGDDFYGDKIKTDYDKTRMLKVMIGMKGDKLNVEQIQQLAEISLKFNVRKMPRKDFEQKVTEAFKKLDFMKNYPFKYDVFFKQIYSPALGDNNNELILPEVLYTKDNKEVKRNGLPAPAKADHRAGKNKGKPLPDRGDASNVRQGMVDDENGTRPTSGSEAQNKIDNEGYKKEDYDKLKNKNN